MRGSAYSVGRVAFDLGNEIEANPYDSRDAEHEEWESGWLSRRAEVEQFQAEYDFSSEGDK
jgi:hypothetical protein